MPEENGMAAHLKLRQHICERVRQELIGPSSLDEVLDGDSPRQRYGAGILFPARIELDEDVDAAQEDVHSALGEEASEAESERNVSKLAPSSEDDGAQLVDGEINRANEFMPSAMGLTVLADLKSGLTVDCSYATYRAVEVSKEGGAVVKGWKRSPRIESITFERGDLIPSDKPLIACREMPGADGENLELRLFVRRARSGDVRSLRLVTVTLVNRAIHGPTNALDAKCLFQCSLSLKSEDPRCFQPLPDRADIEAFDDEAKSQALLYRRKRVYGVGHGTAPDWDKEGEDSEVSCVFSSALPEFEIPPILPSSRPVGKELLMRVLANADAYSENGDAMALCKSLLEDYRQWVQEKADDIAAGAVDDALKDTASRHVEICWTCVKRMQRGIDLLQENADVRNIFALMNEAILVQQLRYNQVSNNPREWTRSENGRLAISTGDAHEDSSTANNKWRPFQLAFILMSLSSIVRQDEAALDERKLVDIIWFPTGGGKTEAYLGLAAFTILWRRSTDPDSSGGTTVLMRYTLRLLTAQQFERASTLICALEELRRRHGAAMLGDEPISIGLWVGQGLSANKNSDAVSALRDLQRRDRSANKFVLIKCPWCGARMGVVLKKPRTIKGYIQKMRPSRVVLKCEAEDCDFSGEDGLPIHVVDDAIYMARPTLVIGTVDKFAMLPWRDQSSAGRIFGVDDNAIKPPELIIQDELHLIAGPLGSMTGHYETLINALCSVEREGEKSGPKIVGSTATISRAPEQVAALYGRKAGDAVLFPPQALDAGDSFFAREHPELPGRKYVGIFATALPSFVTTEVRILATLLQAPRLFDDLKDEELNQFWTIMTYFNSIRELGHAATLVDQDIPEYLAVLARRHKLMPSHGVEAAKRRRWINNPLELTSRISNDQVTEAIDALFRAPPGSGKEAPVDICLATNMIQVGIDVSRLGIMAVIGQPKTTAEYIQSTSRVGRSYPGLVFTLLNPGKPRDRSHFEHFRAFHESIYRNVEPTSVTPFAIPVRERALHAVIIGLARLAFGHTDAHRPPPDSIQKKIADLILERVAHADSDEIEGTRAFIERYFREWKSVGPIRFGTPMTPHAAPQPLMYPAGSDPLHDWSSIARPTPMSMRNVDSECGVRRADLRLTEEDLSDA